MSFGEYKNYKASELEEIFLARYQAPLGNACPSSSA